MADENLNELLEQERKKNAELEEKLRENERKFTEQYKKLLDVEQGIISGEEAIRTIEREHISSLTYHLEKEHKSRLAAEKKLEDERERHEGEIRSINERLDGKERTVEELKSKLDSLKKQLKETHELIGKVEAEGWEKLVDVGDSESELELQPGWFKQSRDLINLLVKIGHIRVSEAAKTIEADRKVVLVSAKLLKKRGMIDVENAKSGDPTLRATKDLVRTVNELRTKMRRRGKGA